MPSSAFQLFNYGAVGLVLWYGTTLVSGAEAFTSVIKVFMVLLMTSMTISDTIALAPDFARGGAAMGSVFGILDRVPAIIPDDPEGDPADHVAGDLELSHVSFSYPTRPQVPIFTDLCLKVSAVGPTAGMFLGYTASAFACMIPYMYAIMCATMCSHEAASGCGWCAGVKPSTSSTCPPYLVWKKIPVIASILLCCHQKAPVVENVLLQVPRGHTMALVGPSGCGKSSVLALILRFYDIAAGAVLVDGKDVREYRLRALRSCIGLVAQEPALFATR